MNHRIRTGLGFLLLAACSEANDGDTTAAEATGATETGHVHETGESGSTGAASTGGESSGSSESGIDSDSTTESSSSSGGVVMDTWENWAHPEYFVPYCIECHPGQSPRDFNDYDVVVDNVEHIRCGSAPEMLPGCDGSIEPGHLPIGDGPFPTDDERWRLVAWIDAGMPRDP